MSGKMKLERVITLIILVFAFDIIAECDCKLVEFEDFVEPEGPWGRQPILRGEGGGFNNILIAVHPDVDEDPAVLDVIKSFFNETSHRLHDASDQTLYFKEITILVPAHWTERPEYATPRPNETVQTARVIIRNEESDGRPPSSSFVRHPGACGEEGEFIYLPAGRLPKDNVTHQAELADELIRLWYRLRWGIGQGPSPIRSQVPSYCLSNTVNWTELSAAGDNFQTFLLSDLVNVTPRYRVIKPSELFSVVILDARQNMKDNGKFTRMIEMYKHYVWHLFPTYSWLGVVAMNNNTISQIHPCTKLWEMASFRSQLQKMLPVDANGTSSLGNAVIESIKLLRKQRQNIRGMPVFIMSDGTDTISPTLAEVQDNITKAGVILTALPYSADKSENIQLNNTINENFALSEMDRLTRLGNQNRFIRIIATDVIRMEEYSVQDFPVLYTNRGYRDQRTLIRVRSDHFTELNITHYATESDFDSGFGTTVDRYWDSWIHVNGTTDVVIYGKVYHLEVLSFVRQDMSLDVFALVFDTASNTAYINEMLQSRTIVEFPIRDYASLVSGVPIFTIITKNQNVVVNSDVRASIARPDGTLISMALYDTGQEYDVVGNDGIYSGLFSEITVEGDYRIKTEVNGPRTYLKRATHFYQLRYAMAAEDLSDHFENAANVTTVLEGNLDLPNAANTTEHFNISFDDVWGNPFYLAVRAVDGGGKRGNISNVIEVYVTELLTTTVDSGISMTTVPGSFETTTDLTTHDTTPERITTQRESTTLIGDTLGSTTAVPNLSYLTTTIPPSTLNPEESLSTRGVTRELSTTTNTESSSDDTTTTVFPFTKQMKKKDEEPTDRTQKEPGCPKLKANCKVTEIKNNYGNTFRETLMIFITTDEAFPAYVITFLLICTATTVCIIVIIYRRRKKRRRAEEMDDPPEEIELMR